jgi:hypothetical protein
MLKGEVPRRATYRILDRPTSRRDDDVLLAEHAIFEEKVIQKTVAIHGYEDALASDDPAFLTRLDHPRITPVYEAQFDSDEDQAITVVMPLFIGGDVEHALRDDYRFSLAESVQIAIDVLDALAYLHRDHRAVHRDTKPGNVLLDASRGRGFLSDFGSAALIDEDGGASAVLGTNVYQPPEARSTGRVGIDADLYGIGIVLWEMVNGRLPWEDLQLADVEARLQRGLRSVPDRMLEFEPHVPDRLRRVIRKAIQRNGTGRYGSAEEFIRALQRVVSIDWRHVDGRGVDGLWLGTWPPRRREEQATEYRVISRVLEAGRDRGKVRLEAAFHQPGGAWRQATADATAGAGDAPAAARFFATVEAGAAPRDRGLTHHPRGGLNRAPSRDQPDGDKRQETLEELEASWWTKQLGHELGSGAKASGQVEEAIPSAVETPEKEEAIPDAVDTRGKVEAAPARLRLQSPDPTEIPKKIRLGDEAPPLQAERPVSPLQPDQSVLPWTTAGRPSATRRLQHQLQALRYSRDQPYIRARQACGYLLLCGLVAVIAWLLVLLLDS